MHIIKFLSKFETIFLFSFYFSFQSYGFSNRFILFAFWKKLIKNGEYIIKEEKRKIKKLKNNKLTNFSHTCFPI